MYMLYFKFMYIKCMYFLLKLCVLNEINKTYIFKKNKMKEYR